MGLNYNHGTGHGVGAYGFIHESPIQVNKSFIVSYTIAIMAENNLVICDFVVFVISESDCFRYVCTAMKSTKWKLDISFQTNQDIMRKETLVYG